MIGQYIQRLQQGCAPERSMANSGGGGGGGTTTSTQYTSNLPEYAKPYFEDVMGRAQSASLTPYQQYTGERVAGFSPTQAAGQQLATNVGLGGTPNAMLAGQQATGLAASNLAGYNYSPTGASYMGVNAPNVDMYQMNQPSDVTGPQLNTYQMNQPVSVHAQYLQYFQMNQPQNVGAGSVGYNLSSRDTGTVGDFMSPYQQQVVDYEKQAAAREYQIANQVRGAQAVKAGAYGGSRQAIENAEAQRNLMSQLQGIQAKGSQSAYDAAQQALQNERQAQIQTGTTNVQNALQAALANQQAGLTAGGQNLQAALGVQQTSAQNALQAALANQQMGYNTGLQNLQAALGVQQLGAQNYMQGALANQQAGLTTGQQNLQAALAAQQLGATTNLQAQQANQSAYQQAQQLAEQSRQFGASSGLQAQQQLASTGQTLGQMGQAEQEAALARANTLQDVGAKQQQLQQQQLDTAYQDYAAQRDYELNMINWYNNILRGTPVSANTAVYQTTPAPSTASQLAGAGLAGLGLYNSMK